jgi:hypothetical protein
MNMVPLFFIIILLLLLGALVALIVGICIAKPAVRRVLLWVLGIILLVPVALFLLLIPMRVAHFQQPNAGQPIVISQVTTEAPSVWQEEIEKQFSADVYSSRQAAAYGLGKQIADKYKTMLTGELQGREITDMAGAVSKSKGPLKIMLCEDTADMAILEACRKGLQNALSKNMIVIQSRAASGPSEGEVWIVFSLQSEAKSLYRKMVTGSGIDLSCNETGTLSAVIQTPEDKMSEQVRYDYRPWLEDMTSFKSHYGSEWFVVFSDTATDLETAQKQVYDKACSILIHSITASGYPPTDVLRENLKQFDIETDTYSQELHGMTGPVWRYAILLDGDSPKLSRLIQSKTQVVSQQRENWIKTGLSLLGMMVIIWIVYSVANAATKGYYSTLLAIMAILAAILVGFLAFIA